MIWMKPESSNTKITIKIPVTVPAYKVFRQIEWFFYLSFTFTFHFHLSGWFTGSILLLPEGLRISLSSSLIFRFLLLPMQGICLCTLIMSLLLSPFFSKILSSLHQRSLFFEKKLASSVSPLICFFRTSVPCIGFFDYLFSFLIISSAVFSLYGLVKLKIHLSGES